MCLADASRRHPHVVLGVNPRGLLAWQRAAQARAFMNQRAFVPLDDVRHLAVPVLSGLMRKSSEAAEPEYEE